MVKQTLTYEDFNGVKHTEDFFFNISERDALHMITNDEQPDLPAYMTKIVEEKDTAKMLAMIERLILLAYGEKSEDGKFFNKSEERSIQFAQSAAYSELFMKLVTDRDAMVAFMTNVLPAKAVSLAATKN